VALALPGLPAVAQPAQPDPAPCVQCLRIRVGPPIVVRGPLPDELDAPFTALKLPDGSFRGFSANGTTYAIDGATLHDMGGSRQAVLTAGQPGSSSDCGRWLTSIMPSGGRLLGFVHQEQDCDYDQGRTHKSMAIASSSDAGLTWTDLGTVITGRDKPQPAGISGEGDCTMADGRDGYLYGYCLRNSDWQTIAARAPIGDPTDWRKYYEGAWNEPGLGGNATAIGFVGPGVGYLQEPGWMAAVTTDPWFGGVRLSLSTDKASFVDVGEPLVTIDAADWHRPADTDLIAYPTILNPETGGNAVGWQFLLSYVYVPPGKGFDSRYLVQQDVSLTLEDQPPAVAVAVALTRWSDPTAHSYVTSTGPLTGDRLGYHQDRTVAYILTRAPAGIPSTKLAECSAERQGRLDQILAEDGSCASEGYARERTAGWLYVAAQAGTVPVYRCADASNRSHFASSAADCEGLGINERLLGYGLAA
jgi:hypothetical protein